MSIYPHDPARDSVPPSLLSHLQARLGLDEAGAHAQLSEWVSSYRPGRAALARAAGAEPTSGAE